MILFLTIMAISMVATWWDIISIELMNDYRAQNSIDFPQNSEVCKISIIPNLHTFTKILAGTFI